MKHLNLTAVVLGLACGSLSAYPVWDEQNRCLKDTVSFFDYNSMPDSTLLAKLVKGDSALYESLRELTKNLDGDCMNFLGEVQGLNHLLDTVTVSGKLAEILGCGKISAPTAIYIYQIMFSEKGEEVGKGFDEYVKGMISDPFVISNDSF